MNLLQFNSIKVKTPENFGELSRWQLLKVAPLLLSSKLRELRAAGSEQNQKKPKKRNTAVIHLINSEFYAIRIQLLFILMNLRWKFRLQFLLWRKITPDYYVGILNDENKVVDWLFEHTLTEQMIPSVRVLGKKYIGPRAYFHSLTYLEYTMAHSRYVAWLDNPTRDNLQEFFAILYRPERKDVPKGHRKYSQDAREPFDAITTDEKAKVFKWLDERVMLVSVLWWMGCSAQKRMDYPYVYTGKAVEDPLTPKQVILKLAGSPKDLDVDGICDAPYDNVMGDLDMANKEAKEKKGPKGLKAI